MDILVITPERWASHEIETCHELLRLGVKRLHIRKPGMPREELNRYLLKIDREFCSRISLHQHHELVDGLALGGKHFKGNQEAVKSDTQAVSKSLHSLQELDKDEPLDYAFLSPVFDSISKQNYPAAFDYNALGEALQKSRTNVMALGGVTPERMQEVKNIGFDGAVMMGAIWQKNSVLERLKIAEKSLDV